MQAADQCTLKNILKSAEQCALRTEGKELSNLEGNFILLWDHPKGHNKIQEFVVVELHKPNMYWIRPVSGIGPEQIVNHRQLQDLQKAHNESDTTSDEKMVRLKVRLK